MGKDRVSSAEVWEQLTLGRKKYACVDLAGKPGSAEERIEMELDEETTFEFLDEPLEDVINLIEDMHNITIILDRKSLEDAAIGSDTRVTQELKAITLRSALRIMLGELGWTYVIDDEVMQITTPESAEEKLIRKVYPVGDLVIPAHLRWHGRRHDGRHGGGMMGGMGGGMGGMGRWPWTRRFPPSASTRGRFARK